METVDWIIATVGVVAIAATTLGVVFYEDLAGEQDVLFSETTNDLADATANVNSAQMISWDARDNATAASFDVQVDFSGQALQGGTASVRIDVRTPDGATVTQTEQLAIAAGATSASGSWSVPQIRFLALPAATTTQGEPFDATHTWSTGYSVTITVTPPGGAAAFPPAGGAPSYTATVGGTETYFQHRIGTTDVGVL